MTIFIAILLIVAIGFVGYAIYQGQRVFEALAKRMEKIPELDVRLFLNISRPDNDTTASEILVSQYLLSACGIFQLRKPFLSLLRIPSLRQQNGADGNHEYKDHT